MNRAAELALVPLDALVVARDQRIEIEITTMAGDRHILARFVAVQGADLDLEDYRALAMNIARRLNRNSERLQR